MYVAKCHTQTVIVIYYSPPVRAARSGRIHRIYISWPLTRPPTDTHLSSNHDNKNTYKVDKRGYVLEQWDSGVQVGEGGRMECHMAHGVDEVGVCRYVLRPKECIWFTLYISIDYWVKMLYLWDV